MLPGNRNKIVWFLLFTLLSVVFCGAQQKVNQRNSFAYIQQQFAHPNKQYGSAPLWVWNARITKPLIDSMLTAFKQQAFGAVMVHPRPGLITPYLSDEWFDMWKYAMEKAKQLDMDIWIYDENSYPSGFAGGNVPAQMPSAYNQGQMLRMEKVKTLPDSSHYFIALEKLPGGSFKNITTGNNDVKGKTGNYYLFSKAYYYTSPWYGGFSYVDLMVPGVTEKFIEVTMKNGYEKKVGNEFGKTVKGIFSDEPNIEVWDTISVRWTPLLFPAFKKKWGYNLETNLPSLFEETGDWQKLRHDYYSTLLELFIEHWSKPMFNYTNKKGLEWTGHYWEHEWPSALHVPDNMAMYAWPQRPGIDMLFNQFDDQSNTAQFGNVRSVKELSSVANQLGKKRVLSETYGGGGWELTFKDMKRLGDWEFVLGINTLNQHLSYMSMEGARKYDYPQSFSYHNPWWPYYRGLNEHFARLSLTLSQGKQKNEVLILEPTTTAWMYYSYVHSNKKFFETGQSFQSFITRLEKAQVEYDLGSEDIIKNHGKVVNGTFIVGEASYKIVIIPPGTENIDTYFYILLKQFADAGGKVLLFNELQYIDGKKDERLKNLQAKCIAFNGLDALNYDVVNKYLPGSGIHFRDLDTTKGNLYHQRRVFSDGQLVFLANSSIKKTAKGSFSVTGKEAVLMDTKTGEIIDYPVTVSGDEILIEYDLPETASLLLFISPKQLTAKKRMAGKKENGVEVVTDPLHIKRLRANVLTLDFCDLRLADTILKNQYFYNAADFLFKHRGFNEGNPWNTSVQYKNNTISRDTFKTNTGFEADYYFNIDAENAAGFNMKAVAERAWLWDLYINGTKVQRNENEWWLDKNFAVFNIGKYVQQGRNTIKLVAPRMSIFAEIEPVYILGDFGLATDTVTWKIVTAQQPAIGSWKEQGMPLYGHELLYSKTFSVTRKTKNYILQLGAWKGTVALLKVNDKQVAILTGNEKEQDISGYVKSGNNTIELVITGSLKNTLGPHYNKPAPGMVSPWHWRYIYKQIPGALYDLYDYGLMEDFHVFQQP